MAQSILSTKEEKKNMLSDELVEVQEVLAIKPRHWNGRYAICVTREEHKDGMVTFMPLEHGNFNVTVASGRKSAKKLEKLEIMVSDNMEKLTELWKQQKYQDMVKVFEEQVLARKLY